MPVCACTNGFELIQFHFSVDFNCFMYFFYDIQCIFFRSVFFSLFSQIQIFSLLLNSFVLYALILLGKNNEFIIPSNNFIEEKKRVERIRFLKIPKILFFFVVQLCVYAVNNIHESNQTIQVPMISLNLYEIMIERCTLQQMYLYVIFFFHYFFLSSIHHKKMDRNLF